MKAKIKAVTLDKIKLSQERDGQRSNSSGGGGGSRQNRREKR